MCLTLERALVPEELRSIVLEAEDVSEQDVVEWQVTLHRNGRWDISVMYPKPGDPAVTIISTYYADIRDEEGPDSPYWNLVWKSADDIFDI